MHRAYHATKSYHYIFMHFRVPNKKNFLFETVLIIGSCLSVCTAVRDINLVDINLSILVELCTDRQS